ncbi:hypothetical protein EON62_05915, partial [archaeon]
MRAVPPTNWQGAKPYLPITMGGTARTAPAPASIPAPTSSGETTFSPHVTGNEQERAVLRLASTALEVIGRIGERLPEPLVPKRPIDSLTAARAAVEHALPRARYFAANMRLVSTVPEGVVHVICNTLPQLSAALRRVSTSAGPGLPQATSVVGYTQRLRQYLETGTLPPSQVALSTSAPAADGHAPPTAPVPVAAASAPRPAAAGAGAASAPPHREGKANDVGMLLSLAKDVLSLVKQIGERVGDRVVDDRPLNSLSDAIESMGFSIFRTKYLVQARDSSKMTADIASMFSQMMWQMSSVLKFRDTSPDAPLSQVRIGTGTMLESALRSLGYRADRAEAMSVSGPQDAAAALEVLQQKYCATLLNPAFSAIG